MKIPSRPPKTNTPSADVATQQWVSTYYTTKSTRPTTYRKNSILAVANTITETDLLNGEIIVGAGIIGPQGVLRLTASGTLLNNSGATQASPRFKLVLGGTTAVDTGALAAAWAASANIGSFRLVAEITNMGAANSQRVEFNLEFCASLFAVNGTATTGSGFYTTAGSDQAKALINNNTSVDTTIAQALAFTVILPVANANVSTNLTSALVEII